MATKHTASCSRVFKRYDAGCPRCQELAAGAAPRAGWQTEYFKRKREQREQFLRDLAEHNCERDGCGPVCTRFDW